MAASLARLTTVRQVARLAPQLRCAATATATPHAVAASAAIRRWAPAAGTVEAVRAFRSFRRPPLERWYTGRPTSDDDRERDERRARRRANHEAFERGMSALGSLLQRGVTAVASGVSHLIDIRSHTERLLLRTGLVKDADAASYAGTTAAVVAWTAVGLTVAGTLGVDTKPLLAGVGITGFTVGFALKDIASNYLSGAFLLMNRPFRPGMIVTVGDPNKKVRGVYVKMDLRYLYLKSDRDGPDADTIILVPNSVVFASDISVSQPKSKSTGGDKDDGKSTLDQITQG